MILSQRKLQFSFIAVTYAKKDLRFYVCVCVCVHVHACTVHITHVLLDELTPIWIPEDPSGCHCPSCFRLLLEIKSFIDLKLEDQNPCRLGYVHVARCSSGPPSLIPDDNTENSFPPDCTSARRGFRRVTLQQCAFIH